jgi:hypothetical protein
MTRPRRHLMGFPDFRNYPGASFRNGAHSAALALSLLFSWLYVFCAGREFADAAYRAVLEQDFSGLGAARADFVFFILFLPVLGLLAYALTRMAIGCGKWTIQSLTALRTRKEIHG